jgi:hypothetical protein
MTPDGELLVSTDNFTRAESDLFFSRIAADGAFATFNHHRELAPLDNQLVVRLNRDTLYSAAVFDLDAAPVTISLPDPGDRFMSMQIITEDQYVPAVVYGAGSHTFCRDDILTRYMLVGIRTFVDPNDPADVEIVHRLQDGVTVHQDRPGTFEIPTWDTASQDKVRAALIQLATTLPDTKGMFGTEANTDPIRRLIGSASAWGGNPEHDAFYLNVNPVENDGDIIHRLTVGDVPVDGFWSVTVYNEQGYFTPNVRNAYSLNGVTAKRNADGRAVIQFGGCADQTDNCLPITPGWNYMVRLYRPQERILNGEWSFPTAQPDVSS